MNTLIQSRFSPKYFLAKPVEEEKVEILLKAAGSAPSSMNEQPWRFIYALKGDTDFNLFFDILKSGNKEWAGNVPMFILTVAKKRFEYKNYPNRFYFHDVGLATENLLLQAVDLGLAAHPMGGFDRERAVDIFAIPDEFEPVTMIAIGYLDEAKENRPTIKDRKPVDEIAFRGKFSSQ